MVDMLASFRRKLDQGGFPTRDQSAESIPAGICAVTGIILDPADGWSLDVAALIASARPNTRLISINFPNNPTAKILEAPGARAPCSN